MTNPTTSIHHVTTADERHPAPAVLVVYGISPEDQESNFMNATLQGDGDLGWSIATHITVPADQQQSELRTAQYLAAVCQAIVRYAQGLGIEVTIEVQVGRNEEG